MKLMNYMEERVIEMNENILRNEAIKAIDTLVRFIENNDGEELREGLKRTPERVSTSSGSRQLWG